MNVRKGKHRGIDMNSIKRQAGVSLVEAMIGIALSMIVVTSMVGLMGNSMGTATRIIEMSQLTDELRNTMSMLTRDIRRANYAPGMTYCYADSDCAINVASGMGDIHIEDNGGDESCVTFNLTRFEPDGSLTTDEAGGFQYRESSGVGRVEMWVGNGSPVCGAASNDWLPVTDDSFVDVTRFTVSDAESFDGTVTGEAGSTLTQRTRRIDVQIDGELILDREISRSIIDSIRVRNDYLN